jgi:hypothetical protein
VINISGKNVKKNQSSFLQANEVTTLNWAARSPDLNPIENIWGIMAKEINIRSCLQTAKFNKMLTLLYLFEFFHFLNFLFYTPLSFFQLGIYTGCPKIRATT